MIRAYLEIFMEIIPIAVLFFLPWVSLIAITYVWRKNASATLVADSNRAYTCSLFLGINALAVSCLVVLPDSMFTLWLSGTPFSLILLAMMIGCVVVICISLWRHLQDVWLWLLTLISIAHIPIYFYLHSLIYGYHFNVELLVGLLFSYACFAIFVSLVWFYNGFGYKRSN